MKYTNVCPKCHASSIAYVPGGAGPYGSGNNIAIGLTTLSAVPVDRYVCVNCGFVEEWIVAPDDLAKIRDRYAQ